MPVRALFVVPGTYTPWTAALRRPPLGFNRNHEHKHPNGGIQHDNDQPAGALPVVHRGYAALPQSDERLPFERPVGQDQIRSPRQNAQRPVYRRLRALRLPQERGGQASAGDRRGSCRRGTPDVRAAARRHGLRQDRRRAEQRGHPVPALVLGKAVRKRLLQVREPLDVRHGEEHTDKRGLHRKSHSEPDRLALL